jgi:hypothetical protein
MVTNYPQEIVTQRVGTAAAGLESGSLLSRLWKRMQYTICSLHGHDPLLHFDQNRMYLRCATCGHETPGWELDQRRPRVRFRGDVQRHYATARSFDSKERRIA